MNLLIARAMRCHRGTSTEHACDCHHVNRSQIEDTKSTHICESS